MVTSLFPCVEGVPPHCGRNPCFGVWRSGIRQRLLSLGRPSPRFTTRRRAAATAFGSRTIRRSTASPSCSGRRCSPSAGPGCATPLRARRSCCTAWRRCSARRWRSCLGGCPPWPSARGSWRLQRGRKARKLPRNSPGARQVATGLSQHRVYRGPFQQPPSAPGRLRALRASELCARLASAAAKRSRPIEAGRRRTWRAHLSSERSCVGAHPCSYDV